MFFTLLTIRREKVKFKSKLLLLVGRSKSKCKVNLATQNVREERYATTSAVVSDFFDEKPWVLLVCLFVCGVSYGGRQMVGKAKYILMTVTNLLRKILSGNEISN